MEGISKSGRWILVVEDDEDDERLATRSISKAGRREDMVVARDGAEALRILKTSSPPILMLLDLKLPRLSGMEVLSAVREDDRLRALPIVILTSGGEPSEVAACYALGCNAFIQKSNNYEVYLDSFTKTLEFWLDVNRLPPIESPLPAEDRKQGIREAIELL